MRRRTPFTATRPHHCMPRWISRCSIAILLMLGLPHAQADSPALSAPLKAYTGRIVYIDFWASWCGPCAKSFPWLNLMQAKYGDRMSFVGVDVDADSAAAKNFLSQHQANFDVLYDPSGQLAEHYHIEGMPSAVILDANGVVVHQHSGFRDDATGGYEAAIRRAVDEPSTSAGFNQ